MSGFNACSRETCLTVSGVGNSEVCWRDWGDRGRGVEGVDDVVWGIGCVVSELDSLW